MKTLRRDEYPPLPDWAKCPICGARVEIEEISEWEQLDDGTWTAASVHIDCVTAPDIDSRKWEDWFDWHWSMPYIDWLPLQDKVEAWFKANFRVDMEASSPDEEQKKLEAWNKGEAINA